MSFDVIARCSQLVGPEGILLIVKQEDEPQTDELRDKIGEWCSHKVYGPLVVNHVIHLSKGKGRDYVYYLHIVNNPTAAIRHLNKLKKSIGVKQKPKGKKERKPSRLYVRWYYKLYQSMAERITKKYKNLDTLIGIGGRYGSRMANIPRIRDGHTQYCVSLMMRTCEEMKFKYHDLVWKHVSEHHLKLLQREANRWKMDPPNSGGIQEDVAACVCKLLKIALRKPKVKGKKK